MASTKKRTAKATKSERSLIVEYLCNSSKDFSYSDYVRVNSNPRGMLLSIGKIHPVEQKALISQEILIPFDVAERLQEIIKNQLAELEQKGLIQRGGDEKTEE